MIARTALLALCLLLIAAPQPLAAEDLGPQIKSNRKPGPEEKAQKAAREACKIEICDILETREQRGPDIACDIGWTWRSEEITDALAGQFDWDWGTIVCRTDLRLRRPALVKAMSASRSSLKVDEHTARCELRHNGEPYVIEMDFTPTIAFKNGKAMDAKIKWGDVSAPSVIYPWLYATTGLDNKSNFLGPEIVSQVNKFVREDCRAVADKLPGRRVN